MTQGNGCEEVYEYHYGGIKNDPLRFRCQRKGPHTYHRCSIGLSAQIEWFTEAEFIKAVTG